jgi:hypothetical protein
MSRTPHFPALTDCRLAVVAARAPGPRLISRCAQSFPEPSEARISALPADSSWITVQAARIRAFCTTAMAGPERLDAASRDAAEPFRSSRRGLPVW